MSLDAFFQTAAPCKTRTRKENANASTAQANTDGQDTAERDDTKAGVMYDAEDANSLKEDMIVERVTKKIEEMLDKQAAAILKPMTELSGKSDIMAQRMANVEQRVSDLEDVSVEYTPRLATMEETLKRTLERLDNVENQSRHQNIRITGLKKGIEDKNPVHFLKNGSQESWIWNR